MAKNTRLVYSTDGSHLKICQECEEDPCQCLKPVEINPAEVTVKVRLEKKGRGGKSVSVLFNLPPNADYWARLTKDLKSFCGSGGSFKQGTIEIQGDQRDKIQKFLQKKGFQVKLAGG